MALVASPSFLKDVQVNWGSIASISEEASKAMEFVQSKVKTPEDIISTAQLPVSSVRDAVILLQQPGCGSGRELEAEELREIVADLIAAYGEPDLQRRIRGIYERQRKAQGSPSPSTPEDYMGELRETLWPCQTDIAEAYMDYQGPLKAYNGSKILFREPSQKVMWKFDVWQMRL